MPKKRQPDEIWQETRKRVWERDLDNGGICAHCLSPVTLEECNIDHIQSGKLASNHLDNLRILCRRSSPPLLSSPAPRRARPGGGAGRRGRYSPPPPPAPPPFGPAGRP